MLIWDENDPATRATRGWHIHDPSKCTDYVNEAKESGLAKAASSSSGRSLALISSSE